MVTALAEGQNSRDFQLKDLSIGQTELATSVMGTKQVVAALQSSNNELATHFQRVQNGMAEVAAKQAKVDSEYEELKIIFSAKASVDAPMSPQDRATADQQHKAAPVPAAGGAGRQRAPRPRRPWQVRRSRGRALQGVSRRGVVCLRPRSQGGDAATECAGAPPRADDFRARIVVKRLPPTMRDRGLVLMPALFDFIVPDQRVQGPMSGITFALVMAEEEAATAALQESSNIESRRLS